MSLLTDILRSAKPAEWTEKDYRHERYFRIPVDKGSLEYNRIVVEFAQKCSMSSIAKLERIQHAYAFARFQLRKSHLKVKLGHDVPESRHFILLALNAINDAIEFNADTRRLDVSGTKRHVLVLKKLNAPNHIRDSNQYPEYLITLESLDYDHLAQSIACLRM